MLPQKVSVIGAPLAFGQGLDGVDGGPKFLRETGLRQRVTEQGWRFEDLGDVAAVVPTASDPQAPEGKNARYSYAVGHTCAKIAVVTREAAAAGSFALTLGGDHSVAVGSVAGVLQARPNLGVVWVDAHADINTPDSSPSGNVHGMPVAVLMRLIDAASIPGYGWMLSEDAVNGPHAVPALQAPSIVYIGLRQLDAGERANLKQLGIKAFDMHAIDKLGIGKVMEQTLDHLTGTGARPLHLSFDIDACDPTIAGSTGTVVEGGLNFREAHYVCEELSSTGMLSSMDMVEVNPRLGDSAADPVRTANMAVGLIGSALGQTVL